MSTALAERPAETALSKDELDLIRRTVASGATDVELKLFLYDCQRRGIHPLDKLLHFTKRGGKYTPVTSIDFMRSQAAASGEMAGSDEPIFANADTAEMSATVTVYRITQGQRYAYTATARWREYCPDNAPMWKRMPHTMLGKCAEALALRKAFPQQLAGLYSKEEMDQVDAPKPIYSVDAPIAPAPLSAEPAREPAAATVENRGTSDDGPDLHADANEDGLYITRVEVRETSNKNVRKHVVVLSDGREVSTINPALGAQATNFCQDRVAVLIQTKSTRFGEDLVTLVRASEVTF